MMPDIRTLMLLSLITNVINAGTIAVIWNQNRRRYAGIFFWLVAMTLQAVGPILHVLRGIIPDLISMTLSNTIMLAGVLIILMGLERFTGKKGWQIHNYVLLAVFIAVSAYFVVIQPNLTARDIAISAMLTIYTFQCCWLLLRRVNPGMRMITHLTGIVFAVYAAFNIARIILLVIFPDQTSDFFKSGAVDALAILGYILLNLCLTISLVLMVNRRLLADVRAQEEKFTTAFHSSPYAIILTRMSDGTILEVNNGFVNITGHQYAEVIGKTTFDLHLWFREEDRLAVINELAQGREILGVEYQFRNKTGEVLTGFFSASRVTINNETCIMASIGDITERNRAEELLRESEKRYRELTDFLPISISTFEVDAAGRIISFNHTALEVFGYNEEDYEEGMNAIQFFAPEEWQRVEENMGKVIQGTSTPGQEFTFMRKDGRKFIGLIYASPTIHQNKTVGIRGVIIDITERKREEAALRESEQRLNNILQGSPIPAFVIGKDHKVMYWNKTLEEMSGIKTEEITGTNQHWKAFYSEKRPCLADLLVDGEIDVIPEWYEGKYTKSKLIEGAYEATDFFPSLGEGGRWLRFTAAIIRNSMGDLIGVLETLEDITERRQMEEAIRASEEKFRSILEEIDEAYYEVDLSGNFTFFNDSVSRRLGYSRQELMGMNYRVYTPEDQLNDLYKTYVNVFQTGETFKWYPFQNIRKDGVHLFIEASISPLRNKEGNITGFRGITRDITERRQMEEKLRTLSIMDDLTGLYNRRGFFTLAQQQMKVIERTKKDMLLFFADLDKMKQINDTLGHQEGDKALVEIATILKEVFRESDIMGRMGGDEFAILAIDTTNETREVLIIRLQNTLDDYNKPEGRNYQLSLSIGIAPYDPETPCSLDDLMAQADKLMYEEKRNKQH